jgi:dipeptidyl aminopeptidase/acylaminoacyl peptidase
MIAMVKCLQIHVASLVFLLSTIFCIGAHAAPNAAPAAREGGLREQSGPALESPQRRRRGYEQQGVYKTRIEPHWFAENSRFWYRNRLRDGKKEFILVDAAGGTRQKAFDHEKLAEALSAASESTQKPDDLPFDRIEFVDDGKAVRFVAEQSQWEWELDAGEIKKLGEASDEEADDDESENDRFRRWRRFRRDGDGRDRRAVGGPSPDGTWHAFVRNHNVYIRPAGKDDEDDAAKKLEFQLTVDGIGNGRYGMLQWSPDSKRLVAFRIEPGDNKEVHLIESSPEGGGRAKMRSRSYDLPGDKLTSYELNLFDVETKKQIKPEVEKIDLHFPRLYWNKDGRHFAYEKVGRGHQRLRIIRVDSHTGETSDIIDEKTETFIWTAHTENLNLDRLNWLPDTDEAIYVTERDGWRHLYLLDTKDGGTKNQITEGDYVVRGVDRIDEEKRQIWFHASGKNGGQDPYFMHYYRVNFDGTGLMVLTEADGNHSVQFSPDHKYAIDTYSRVDAPPKHELRRTQDGKLICMLDEADAEELFASSDYHPLEVFVAKGRDGETDIWGVICRPRDFDPNKKYPILESIYAGPQGSFVPKSFGGGGRYAQMADLGFIVVQIDGMGTANRSKAFHDVCWHNLKDAGFPDRILWIKAAAEKYPYMDTTRVGVYGGSAGGQNAAAAVLFHPEFYKVAVAGCGCHDNRMDKASWNEQWMGYPVGPQYAVCSNIDNAHRLQGKLMLILGELDENVPIESTTRFVDALIKADKEFDFVFVPGAGHGMGGEYGARRMRDFFVRHLIRAQPSDPNAPAAAEVAQTTGDAPEQSLPAKVTEGSAED